MHDIKLIRDNPQGFTQAMERRGLAINAEEILALDSTRRANQTRLQELQSERNLKSKQIGDVKKQGGDANAVMEEVAALKAEMAALEATLTVDSVTQALEQIPNRLQDDIPDGPDENANLQIREWGQPAQFMFTPKDHVALGEGLGLMDFATAAEISGARFVLLSGALAQLERALGQFMLDLHVRDHGYTETAPPFLVRADALYGTGQLPKFAEDLYRTADDYWLIPTAEVPLTNIVANKILSADHLPKRYTAFTPCFRSEAGAAGRDTRGMIRQHQFNKVEMVAVTHPEESAAEHERMTECAEKVLQKLGLPYRVMLLCSGDTGFSAQKTYDLEVWLPAQNTYREISSCSNCGDFQARRMKARFRPAGDEKGTEFVHTLNGSGVATGRALIAVMENYQQEDGSIIVPEALRPYMHGLPVITKV